MGVVFSIFAITPITKVIGVGVSTIVVSVEAGITSVVWTRDYVATPVADWPIHQDIPERHHILQSEVGVLHQAHIIEDLLGLCRRHPNTDKEVDDLVRMDPAIPVLVHLSEKLVSNIQLRFFEEFEMQSTRFQGLFFPSALLCSLYIFVDKNQSLW